VTSESTEKPQAQKERGSRANESRAGRRVTREGHTVEKEKKGDSKGATRR